MNLIANRHLDGAQKQVIYELTLKKRQSKKSTMSDRQRAAKQQLAKELMLERRIPPSLGSVSSQHTIDSFAISSTNSDSLSHADQQSLLNELLLVQPVGNSSPPPSPPTATATTATTTTTTGATTCRTCCCVTPSSVDTSTTITTNNSSSHSTSQQQTTEAQQQQLIDNPPGFREGGGVATRFNCASCNFTRSDSTYSGSSVITADSGSSSSSGLSGNNNRHHNVNDPRSQQNQHNNTMIDDDIVYKEARRKEALVRVNKLKLEHLNYELERKLNQYEYLVAQEKAMLGTYNMMLFTNQGVNNFHLHRDI